MTMRTTMTPTHHATIKINYRAFICGNNLLGLFHLDLLCGVHTLANEETNKALQPPPHRSVSHSIIPAVLITSCKQSFAEMVADSSIC